MKRLIALLLILTMLPLPGVFAAQAPSEEENRVIPQEAYETVAEDVWQDIAALEKKEVIAKRGTKATEQDYAAIVEDVAAAVEGSDTYVEDSLNRNGAFLTWETTEGVVCGYSPRLRQQAYTTSTTAAASQEEIPLPALKNTSTSTAVTVFQPFYGLDSNFTEQYQNEGRRIAAYTGGSYSLYVREEATIDAIARAMENSAVVIFDSHGDTDYYNPFNPMDYTSGANTSYLLLQTGQGLTAKDQGKVYGPYGEYYHAFYGGTGVSGMNYYYVDGTVIANHMKKSAPNNLVWNAICLGMATDGIAQPLMNKGVGVVYGYSQSVTFVNDIVWEQFFWDFMCKGYDVATAVLHMKEEGGYWDMSPKLYDLQNWYYDGDTVYTVQEAQDYFAAFPIVVSAADAYPGKGNVDGLQTVWTGWKLQGSCPHTDSYTSISAPTCTNPGTTNVYCSNCNALLSSYVSAPATGHGAEYYRETVPATCITQGQADYYCGYCDQYLYSAPSPLANHTLDFGTVTVYPTETTPGEAVCTCSVCGKTITEVIPPNTTYAGCPSANFSDLNRSFWYHSYVDYVLQQGMMNGISSTKFNPEGDLTRAMLVTILYRSVGQPEVTHLSHPFRDVGEDLWYSDAVTWAYNAGIVNGMTADAFAPDSRITREQIVTILYRFNGEEAATGNLDGFPDSQEVSGYARQAMAWAIGAEIINGKSGRIAPLENATRCQVAKILACYLQGKKSTMWSVSYRTFLKIMDRDAKPSYVLYDVTGDGIPELIVRTSWLEADAAYDFYTWQEGRGVVCLGTLSGSHMYPAGYAGQEGMLLCFGHMGDEVYFQCTWENGELISRELFRQHTEGEYLPVDYLELYGVEDTQGLTWTENPPDHNYEILAPHF